MSRRWLVIASAAAHFALIVGLFAAGVWHIEQLPAGHHVTASLGVMSPPAASGGPIAARKVDIVKRPVHELVQPEPIVKKVEQLAATTASETADTGGTGSGTGSGSGDDPTGTGGCVSPPCGISEVAAAVLPKIPEPPPVVEKPKFVPPVVIEALRTSGETQLAPSAGTANEMVRDGKMRVTGAFRVCLTASGEVSSVAMVVSTRYAAYDAVLAEGLRSWRYRPYLVDNRPTPVCGNVAFIYTMH
jgi:hypothetical protein